MLNKKEFANIRKRLETTNNKREECIHASRELINLSKQAIYSSQRGDLKHAERLIKAIKLKAAKLNPADSLDTNINRVALQEYVEALCLYRFLSSGKLPSYSSLKVPVEDYLAGLCDLTGELVRKAVFNVINNKISDAIRIKELVDELYGEFLKFNLRNGELRKKSDSIKWNLKKLEEIMYDLSLKRQKKE